MVTDWNYYKIKNELKGEEGNGELLNGSRVSVLQGEIVEVSCTKVNILNDTELYTKAW